MSNVQHILPSSFFCGGAEAELPYVLEVALFSFAIRASSTDFLAVLFFFSGILAKRLSVNLLYPSSYCFPPYLGGEIEEALTK